jgi:hypothetical protein
VIDDPAPAPSAHGECLRRINRAGHELPDAAGSRRIDKIWDAENTRGNIDLVWLDREPACRLNGRSRSSSSNAVPLGRARRTFDWRTVSIGEYGQVAQDGCATSPTSRYLRHVDVQEARRKLLTLVGANDQLSCRAA